MTTQEEVKDLLSKNNIVLSDYIQKTVNRLLVTDNLEIIKNVSVLLEVFALKLTQEINKREPKEHMDDSNVRAMAAMLKGQITVFVTNMLQYRDFVNQNTKN